MINLSKKTDGVWIPDNEKELAENDSSYKPTTVYYTQMAQGELNDVFGISDNPAVVIAKHVTKIENLAMGDTPITNGKQFAKMLDDIGADYETSGFIRNLIAVIRNAGKLDENKRKNSK